MASNFKYQNSTPTLLHTNECKPMIGIHTTLICQIKKNKWEFDNTKWKILGLTRQCDRVVKVLVLGKQKCQAFLAVSPVRKSVGSNPTVVIFWDDTFLFGLGL